jgi:hypothetical protein
VLSLGKILGLWQERRKIRRYSHLIFSERTKPDTLDCTERPSASIGWSWSILMSIARSIMSIPKLLFLEIASSEQ